MVLGNVEKSVREKVKEKGKEKIMYDKMVQKMYLLFKNLCAALTVAITSKCIIKRNVKKLCKIYKLQEKKNCRRFFFKKEAQSDLYLTLV